MANPCSQHDGELLNILCMDCKVLMCTLCMLRSHNRMHNIVQIKEASASLRLLLKSDIKAMTDMISRCDKVTRGFDKYKSKLDLQVSKCQLDICEAANAQIALINRNKEELLEKLSHEKEDRMAKVQHFREGLATQLSHVKTLVNYEQQLLDRGTIIDMARETARLHDQATELVSGGSIAAELSNFDQVALSFAQIDLPAKCGGNAVGAIRITLPGYTHVT